MIRSRHIVGHQIDAIDSLVHIWEHELSGMQCYTHLDLALLPKWNRNIDPAHVPTIIVLTCKVLTVQVNSIQLFFGHQCLEGFGQFAWIVQKVFRSACTSHSEPKLESATTCFF